MRLSRTVAFPYNSMNLGLGKNSHSAGNPGKQCGFLGEEEPFKTNSKMHSLAPFTTFYVSELSMYLKIMFIFGMKLFLVLQKLL